MIVEDTPIEALPSFRTIWHPHDQNKIEIKGQSADEIAEELVKGAEDRLCQRLAEKAQLDQDYRKKLEESHIDGFRLKQLLENEKYKHEATWRELEQMKLKVQCIQSKCREELDVDMKTMDNTLDGETSQSECCQFFCEVNDELDLIELFFEKDVNTTDQSMQDSSSIKACQRVQNFAKSGVLKLMKEQEAQWKSVRDAVDNLGRRLTLIESKKIKIEELVDRIKYDARSANNAEDLLTKLERTSEEDLARHYTCIFVSPIFEDRKSNVVYRSNAGRKQLNGQKNMEVQEPKAEIQNLRLQGYENQTRQKTNLLYEKLQDNSSKMSKSVPRLHGERQLLQFEEALHPLCMPRAVGWGVSDVNDDNHCPPPINECAPHGFMKVMKEKLAESKRENARSLFLVAEQYENHIMTGRESQNPETKQRDDPKMLELLSHRMQKANQVTDDQCGELKPLEMSRSSLQCELHMLEETLQKLAETCLGQGIKFPGCTRSFTEGENINIQALRSFCFDFLSEMRKLCLMQELQIESCKINENTESTWKRELSGALEESETLKACLRSTRRDLEDEVNKNKVLSEKVENQAKHLASMTEENRIELERKENTICFAQKLNTQLANDMSKIETSLAELRSRYKGIVASLETQLNDANGDLESLQETADQLAQQLKNSEAKRVTLERSLEDKDKQMDELKRRMQAVQNETDATVMEKFELVTKSQDLKKDYEEQKHRVRELVSINEELTRFSHAKDDQEGARLLQIVKVKSDENNKLKQELDDIRKDIRTLREEDETLKHRYKFMKEKLYETEYELTQREEALERLTKHLAAAIEGEDSIFEAAEHLKISLVNASKREGIMGEQLKQSRFLIDDLNEEMACMESEVVKARRKMANMKEQNNQAEEAAEKKQEVDERQRNQQ